MFTGIVSEIGTVADLTSNAGRTTIGVAAPRTTAELHIGDSVAVNGVCLTVVATADDRFAVEAVAETMHRTNLGELRTGAGVNLERPLSGEGRFDGHIVQGHVDGAGTIVSVAAEGDSHRVRIELASDLGRYVVEKGSITVDGVSLTVTAVSPPAAPQAWFEVVLIPHTRTVTILGEWAESATVNVEVDILAKYIERLLEFRA